MTLACLKGLREPDAEVYESASPSLEAIDEPIEAEDELFFDGLFRP